MKVGLLTTTWNRTPQLRRSLERMEQLTIPDEILVVNDGGGDDCEQMCAEFKGRLPIRYAYLDNPGLNLSSFPRNWAIKQVDWDLVITSEPEMWFITDVVKQFVDKWCWWKSQGIDKLISAGVIFHAQTEDMTTPESANRLQGWVAPYVALYERSKMLEVGGWDESAPGPWGHDDTEFLTRLRIHGTGQDIETSIEAFHQWHENPGRDKFGAMFNDEWVKNFDYEDDPSKAIANVGKEWGTGYVPRDKLFHP